MSRIQDVEEPTVAEKLEILNTYLLDMEESSEEVYPRNAEFQVMLEALTLLKEQLIQPLERVEKTQV